MKTSLYNSLVVSAAVHLSIIGPSLSAVKAPEFLRKESKPAGPLVVDYVILKDPVKIDTAGQAAQVKAAHPAGPSVPGIKMESFREKTGAAGVPMDRDVAIKPRYVTGKKEHAAPRAANTERSTVKRVDARGDIPVGDIIKKQARLRSTKEFVSYFSLIRENIRRELKIKYKNYHGEGDVHVVFVLDADGRLAGIEADASGPPHDNRLADIAAASVRKASPFPHFPKSFPLRQMYFNLIVSFKRQ